MLSLLQIAVSWTATCGTLVAMGDSARYTAPSVGPCLVIASAGTAKDTARVTVALPDIVTKSAPYGFLQGLDATCGNPFTLASDMTTPANVTLQIDRARACGMGVVFQFPCGGVHRQDNLGLCLSLVNGVATFDRQKFDQQLARFNTAAIRTAIAAGVADGSIVGVNVMDEPMTSGANDGNTWGPPGTMTKARVDSLCRAVRSVFPTLPAGVAHQHQAFEPTKNYQSCDFTIDQYGTQYGSVTTWRDAGLAIANRQHTTTIFSMNLWNGGTQDKDGTWDCTGTPGKGLYAPNCRMTPAQIKTAGLALIPAGCGMFMWRYDAALMTQANVPVFAELADSSARRVRKACVRW